jgi:hypothetical protein
MSLRAVVQSQDAESARALRDVLRNAAFVLGQVPDVRQFFPDMEKLIVELLPKQEGNRLVLDANDQTLMAALQPTLRQVREAADGMTLTSKLKQIGLAMHNHEATHGGLPPQATYSPQGKPLLSWRVQVLPYLEQEPLYRQFRLDEPWDSEHNKKLIARMPEVFKGDNPKLNVEGKTTLLVPAGPGTIFEGKERARIRDIHDGTSNTVMAVQATDDRAVFWTQPADWELDPKKPAAGLAERTGGYLLLFADGSVRTIKKTIKPEVLKALFTKSGGEVIQLP